MFIKQFLLFAAVLGFAAATVPSYIHVCGAKNPKLDECVTNSVISLRDKLREGIPELEVPPLEPLKIGIVKLADLPNFQAIGTDIKLQGLSQFKVNSLHVDLAKHQIDLDIQFDETKLDALYNVTAKILVPIVGKGPITLVAKDVNAKVKINTKIHQHGGKNYLFVPSMTTRLSIKDYTVKFVAENFDKTLQDAVAQALGNSKEEILESTRPNLEKAISAYCLDVSNKITKHFTYEELFPDRE